MPPELIVFGILAIGAVLYVLLGGADFGAGIWELNSAFQSPDDERRFLFGAIGPVWEANHVWLIFVLILLWTAFPPVFAGLCRALWLPLLLALAGILFRGVGFAFHINGVGGVRQQAFWGAVFALASAAAPFFLGAAFGAGMSATLAIDERGDFHGNYLTTWLSPLAIFSAFFFVGVCAYLAAVYLTREAAMAHRTSLLHLWQQRALTTGIWMGLLAMTGLVLIYTEVPHMWTAFLTRSWPLVALSMASGAASLLALWRCRTTLATATAILAVISVIVGWGAAQYPYLIAPGLTIYNAASPANVLWLMIIGLTVGMLLLLPSLWYLFHLFKSHRYTI
ncbi:MAG: cytochrome d ubiquinol oxidase subunit II [Deltaproteobacteria bacterium]|nr:cytochrome d ubiquinol oxidase subunit II [Deltaproteobacteria bacterium]